MNKKWPRWAGALAGFVFLALFVLVPDIRRIGWQPYMMGVGAIAGVVGAVMGWLLVIVRNRLMISR